MIKELGGFFGWIIIIAYGIALSNYIFKYVNKKHSKLIKKNENVKKIYGSLMKKVIKYHKIFGILSCVFIVIHFSIQYINIGINILGLISAVFMICQVCLGIYIQKKKTRKSIEFYSHRAIALILIISISLHVLLK